MERQVIDITSREQWLALREKDITASRVAALFDAHPFMSRADLDMQLRGGKNTNDTPAMRRGRLLEPAVGVALHEEYPDWDIRKADTYHRIPAIRLGGTPDFWLGEDGLIQAKTASPETFEKWGGRPPLAYQLQTLVELMVTNRKFAKIAVLVHDRNLPLYVYDVPRHPAAEQRIIDAVNAWWSAWDAGQTALPSSPNGLTELLDDGSVIDLSGINWLSALLEKRTTLKEMVRSAYEELEDIDNSIKNAMGNAALGILPRWRVSFKTIKTREHMVKASQRRRLTVTQTGE